MKRYLDIEFETDGSTTIYDRKQSSKRYNGNDCSIPIVASIVIAIPFLILIVTAIVKL